MSTVYQFVVNASRTCFCYVITPPIDLNDKDNYEWHDVAQESTENDCCNSVSCLGTNQVYTDLEVVEQYVDRNHPTYIWIITEFHKLGINLLESTQNRLQVLDV